MRLFYALLFPESTLQQLTSIQNTIVPYLSKGNPTSKGNLHLTLAFLGEQDEKILPLLGDILEAMPKREVEVLFNHLGTFPKQGGDIIYSGIAHHTRLFQLQKTLIALLQEYHVVFKDTRFKAHITLFRRARFKELPDMPLFSSKAKSIALMQSHRVQGVLTYTPLISKTIQ
ncbi:RNA 2',3'-cyclic phosphodiesterase [Sphaerochaeta sp. S2]|uniref:RNA 2',3'-cyclic phosphodiesterase n=1 Tax=Sphaerochaeta sp. S2 TaxID=2798868 RepID=UPI0018E97BAA|nr:RNA 2',3'-cyclic phosphodiesterase [Sphaerochaeta sp. S2]MBJ2355418.1 RNA 2',3'-cyclic phosphodiesterase [Sphaerochaeta sp. S2]